LIEQVQGEMEKGTDPASEAMQALARRWLELIEEFTGGDARIRQSLNNMYQQEGAEALTGGAVSSVMSNYMGRAIAAMKQAE
jgi:MerR family transcriptional regulator, thiopeptide resistance regulator